MGVFVMDIKGFPIKVYGKTRRQAQLAKAYIEKTMEIPDMSPAAQAARMANARHEAMERRKKLDPNRPWAGPK